MEGPGLHILPPATWFPAGTEDDVDILEMLDDDEDAIVAEALPAVTWLEHYGRDGEELARERLRALCRLVADAIRTQDLGGLLAHASRIARERHEAGYDRNEVARAFSAVEEAIWHRALQQLPSEGRTWALGLVGTALQQAREALSRAFVEAGAGSIPAFVDMSPLFRGAVEAPGRFADDMVYPV